MRLPQEMIYQILDKCESRFLCTLLGTSKDVYIDATGIIHSRLQRLLNEATDQKLLVWID
jgi:hypothetical protein